MKKIATSVARIVALVCLIIANAATNTSKATNITTANDSANRAVAIVMAAYLNDVVNQLTTSKVPINKAEVGRYITMAINEQDLGMTIADAFAYFDKIAKSTSQSLNTDASEEFDKNEQAIANKQAGKAFLDKNRKRPNVKVLPSGLQYEVITNGNGPTPTANDQVEVHYTGRLIDGTVFDSSVDRGVPVTFGVTQVIPGFAEALKLMKTGSKWKIFIPSDLAYGREGAGNIIGPNQTIIFDVELLKVIRK